MIKRKHTNEFKSKVALEAILGEETVAAIAQKHGVHPGQVQNWKAQLLEAMPKVFGGKKYVEESSEKMKEVFERKIGQLTMENDFLKKKYQTYLGMRGCK